MIRIVDYFREKYNRIIEYELWPWMDIGKYADRPNYVPMELSELGHGGLGGQLYVRHRQYHWTVRIQYLKHRIQTDDTMSGRHSTLLNGWSVKRFGV